MNPAEWLIRTSRLKPAAPALIAGHTVKADYACFADRVSRIAGALARDYKIAKGDRVAIFMSNRTEYLEVIYGIWFTGAVVVPINAKLHVKEVAWIIEDAGAEIVFVSNDVAGALNGLASGCLKAIIYADSLDYIELRESRAMRRPVVIDDFDLLWLFYTSGTTGRPKGVMISAGNISAMALSYFSDVDEVSSDDAILYAAPMSHGAGIYNFMYVIKGARHVVPDSRRFDVDEILMLAPKINNISMFAAPTMVKRLVDRARATRSTGAGIKTIIYAGGPMYVADIIAAVEVFGDKFVQVYGQGECPMGITALRREFIRDREHVNWRRRLGSVGVAQSPVLVRIGDREGAMVPNGVIGEILVSGTTVMTGYWQNPDATTTAIRNGWLWTGDMGSMDSDGFVTLHDRSKDMIISGGSNIYPREVEEVLLQLAAVAEVAVVGRIHPEWGEVVVAFIVVAVGHVLETDDLDAHCLANMARFKRPKEYQIISVLPKNNYGKVLKTDLRQHLKNEESYEQ